MSKRRNYRPLFVFLGIILLMNALVIFVIEPRILDELGVNLGATCGQTVAFDIEIDRGQLADPFIDKITVNGQTITIPPACGCWLYGCGCNAGFSLSDLNSKVQIKIGDFKTIETSELSIPRLGGSGRVTVDQPIPCGAYQVVFTNYNKGGLCVPVVSPCEWIGDFNNKVTKTLTVSKSGVTLT